MNEQPKGHCKHGEFDLAKGCPKCIAERREHCGSSGIEPVTAAQEAPPVSIVKVRYMNKTTGEPEGREYSYFTAEPLGLDFHVKAPTHHGFVEAIVTALDVPEAELAAFRDRVKTIPAGSIMVRPAPDIFQGVPFGEGVVATASEPSQEAESAGKSPPSLIDKVEIPTVAQAAEEGEHLQARLSLSENASEETKEAAAVLEDITGGQIQVIQPDPALPDFLPAPLELLYTQVDRYPHYDLLRVCQEAIKLRDFAVARIILTNEDLKPATDDLSIIAKAKKVILEKKTEILAPFKAKVDVINQAFAQLLAPLEEADQINRDKVKEFRQIEQEKIALAQREAAAQGGEFTTELQTPVPEHTRTELGTQGFQKVYKWQVTDFAQVPDQYKMIDAGKVQGVVKGSKGTIEIPGIKVWADKTVRINTK